MIVGASSFVVRRRSTNDPDNEHYRLGEQGPLGSATPEGLNKVRVVEILTRYLEKSGLTISRAMAQERMFAKLAGPAFLTDMRPLVSSDRAETLNEETMKDAFRQVFSELIELIPGDDWRQTPDMIERFALKDHVRRPGGSIPENSR